jgi:hypothetical protein
MKRTVILVAAGALLALGGCHKKPADDTAAVSTEAAPAAAVASAPAADASAAAMSTAPAADTASSSAAPDAMASGAAK